MSQHRKPRILLDNEFSQYATGYSVYGKEVLSRLHATGKYEIAEFAAYGHAKDTRAYMVPWSYYGNQPGTYQNGQVIGNSPESQHYEAVYDHRFGRFRFEFAVCDFKPDIVFCIRDPWMDKHVFESPLRPYFKLAIMPTVDSTPLEDSWISWYMDADAIFTYSDWAATILEKQGGTAVMDKYMGTASPAANMEIFKPFEKEKSRELLGIDKDRLIIGTVMRNQRRKLYPDLFIAFRNLLNKLVAEGKSHIADKTYLYIHCAYPDLGWDIPKLLKENGITNKIMMTYLCNTPGCKHVFVNTYQDVCCMCPKCHNLSAQHPGTVNGVDPQVLAHIMASFDIYVQYAICEGFGMPIVEAAACGVPTISTDYSAMEDFKKSLKSIPIAPQRLFLEPETNAYRCYPDNNQLVNELFNFLSMSKDKRDRMRKTSYVNMNKSYSWDTTAAQWMKYFDTVDLRQTEAAWKNPPQIVRPQPQLNAQLTNGEFVRWAYVNILGRPDKCYSYDAMRHIRDINFGVRNEVQNGVLAYSADSIGGHHKNIVKFGRDELVKELMGMRQYWNQWEAIRCGLEPMPPVEMLRYAKRVDR